jgi:hypothetical protein
MRGSSLIDIQGKRTEQFPIGQNGEGLLDLSKIGLVYATKNLVSGA